MIENKVNAIKKINDEIKSENDRYTQVIGYYVLKELKKECNLNAAEHIANGVKDIKGCLMAMKNEAEKKIIKRSGMQVAVLTDSEAFEIVNKYFNLNGFKDTNLVVSNKNKNNNHEKNNGNSEKKKSEVITTHKVDDESKSNNKKTETKIKEQLQFNI